MREREWKAESGTERERDLKFPKGGDKSILCFKGPMISNWIFDKNDANDKKMERHFYNAKIQLPTCISISIKVIVK